MVIIEAMEPEPAEPEPMEERPRPRRPKRERRYFDCSICQHLKKQCTDGCEYREYFPGHHYETVKIAFKKFGMSKVRKAVKRLQEGERMSAINAHVWVANAFRGDMVQGPYALYAKEYCDCKDLRTENKSLRSEIIKLKKREAQRVNMTDIELNITDIPSVISLQKPFLVCLQLDNLTDRPLGPFEVSMPQNDNLAIIDGSQATPLLEAFGTFKCHLKLVARNIGPQKISGIMVHDRTEEKMYKQLQDVEIFVGEGEN